MPTKTPIEWCDYSSNPIKYRDNETGAVVWACVKKSDGCTNCYAEALARRWNRGRAFSRPNIDTVTPFLDEQEMKRLATDPKLSGKRVFVGDMTDLFGSWIPDDFLDHLFAVFAWRQDVTFQVLTKRPQRMVAWFREAFQFRRTDGGIGYHGRQERVFEQMQESPYVAIDPFNDAHWKPDGSFRWPGWPLPNVWLGTSAEDDRVRGRVDVLRDVPAAVRFISVEPMLGPLPNLDLTGISWVITGGESGPRYRPMDPAWARDVRDQCIAAGVSYFHKQNGGRSPKANGRELDGVTHDDFPRVAAAAGASS